MPAIHLTNLAFAYSSAVVVLEEVTLHLGPGWTGVVGGNGSGKTTLLRLVTGELSPTRGSVTWDPSDAIVVMCAQEVEHRDAAIDRLATSWDPLDVRLRGELGLESSELARWETLSPGERKRWQVGSALARRPDVLLLDEPSNHLDSDGRDWLVSALDGFGGVGLVVSHDRGLLEHLTTQTLRLRHRDVSLWGGSYRVAHAAWTAADREVLAEYTRLRSEQRKAEKRVSDQRRRAEAKRAEFRRRQRTSEPKDIDARSAAATRRYREGEKAAAKILATTVSARERIDEELDGMSVTRELGRSVFVDYEPAPKSTLAVVRGGLVAGDRELLDETTVAIHRDDRIWLRGPNGAGKTTLLEAIRVASGLPDAKMLYLPQELSRDSAVAALHTVGRLRHDERGRVLAIVAALGVDPEQLLASERPSPGEARKLMLALGLGRRAWLVLLDEPTNHMDLPSVERLEVALSAYPGGMVVVTHDGAFGAALGLTEWEIIDGELRR